MVSNVDTTTDILIHKSGMLVSVFTEFEIEDIQFMHVLKEELVSFKERVKNMIICQTISAKSHALAVNFPGEGIPFHSWEGFVMVETVFTPYVCHDQECFKICYEEIGWKSINLGG